MYTLHPVLVHFPVACWSLATCTDLITIFYKTHYASWFAGMLLAIATIMALLTIMTGLIEYGKLPDEESVLSLANRHMTFALSTSLIYGVSLALRWDNSMIVLPGLPALGFSLLGFICLCITGKLGGKLVYEYGIGVKKG